MGNRLYTTSYPFAVAASNSISIDANPGTRTYYSVGHFSNEVFYRYRVGNRVCTLRLTAYINNNYSYKTTVKLLDCDGADEARVDVCIGTESNSNGSKLKSEEISYQGKVSEFREGENKVALSYGSYLREGLMIIERRKETLVIAHNYWCIDKAQCLVVVEEIKCDRHKGIFAKSYGPFRNYTNLQAMQALHSQRIRSMKAGSRSPNNAVQVQSAVNALRGLINNLGVQNNGDYNCSINIINNNHYYGREEVEGEGVGEGEGEGDA